MKTIGVRASSYPAEGSGKTREKIIINSSHSWRIYRVRAYGGCHADIIQPRRNVFTITCFTLESLPDFSAQMKAYASLYVCRMRYKGSKGHNVPYDATKIEKYSELTKFFNGRMQKGAEKCVKLQFYGFTKLWERAEFGHKKAFPKDDGKAILNLTGTSVCMSIIYCLFLEVKGVIWVNGSG